MNFSRSRDHSPPRVGVWFRPVETSGSPLLLLLFTDTTDGSPGRLFITTDCGAVTAISSASGALAAGTDADLKALAGFGDRPHRCCRCS